jgi:recombination protein RecR
VSYPRTVEKLILEFEKLPGIGRRSAERLAFHILRLPRAEAAALATAIRDARVETRLCSLCCNVSERDPCEICSDESRTREKIMVVADPRDVRAFERAGIFRGLYHVLMGSVNPADGVEPRHLSLEQLVQRVRGGGIEEIILATDPDFEGDGTALVIFESLRRLPVRITRLARGIPAGSSIEHLNRAVLEEALEGRR